jgi:tetratricopeptide (TPR) repeat protein
LADAVRTRFEAAAAAKDTGDQRNTLLRSRWGDALRTIHAAQRDIKAYVAVCEETELLPGDCEVVAKILQARGKIEDALAWVDRGLGGKETERWGRGSSCDLVDMKRSLLKKLGRDEEALESAWQEFVEHPGKFTYEELMKYVPKGKRSFWHEKAMEISAKADLSPALELFLESRETERLLERLRMASKEDLESLSHYVAGPAASKIQRSHPEVAAKLFCAMGMRVLTAKKSKYYEAALSNFEQAKRCYERAGLSSSWQEIVDAVREEHHRKCSFMPGFEQIVRGRGPSTEPSFLDRAKKRWEKR